MRRLLDIEKEFVIPPQGFGGYVPIEWLDQHPARSLAALRVVDVRAGIEQAGVWNVQTGELVWAPENSILIAWANGGEEVLVLCRHYQRDPNHPAQLVSPLQSEFIHVLERRSWPERALIGACNVQFPTGWASELTASPAANLASVTWLEQDCAGFILVRWKDGSGEQLVGIGPHGDGCYVEPNLIQGPVFSPDGRFAVASSTRWSWWARGGNPETPSPGGQFIAGKAVILDTTVMRFTEHDAVANVPAGWCPSDFFQELIGYPVFLDSKRFEIELGTGQRVGFSLPADVEDWHQGAYEQFIRDDSAEDSIYDSQQ